MKKLWCFLRIPLGKSIVPPWYTNSWDISGSMLMVHIRLARKSDLTIDAFSNDSTKLNFENGSIARGRQCPFWRNTEEELSCPEDERYVFRNSATISYRLEGLFPRDPHNSLIFSSRNPTETFSAFSSILYTPHKWMVFAVCIARCIKADE